MFLSQHRKHLEREAEEVCADTELSLKLRLMTQFIILEEPKVFSRKKRSRKRNDDANSPLLSCCFSVRRYKPSKVINYVPQKHTRRVGPLGRR
jgi:hypothetical protein